MQPTTSPDQPADAAEFNYHVARHHEARWKREERLRLAVQRREDRPRHREDRRASRRRRWDDDR